MASLNWQPTNTDTKPDHRSSDGWDIGDPWFGVSIGLLGVIAGYTANVYIL